MFSAVRQGSPIFVLDKDNLSLKIGTVASATQPTFGNQWIPNMPMQPMDISVKFDDGESMEFKQVQPNAAVAYYGKVTITETKELMVQEVEQMMRNAKSIIDSVPYNEQVLDSCNSMLTILSPSFAKEQQTDKDIASLKENINGINSDISGINSDIGEIKKMLLLMSSSKPSKN